MKEMDLLKLLSLVSENARLTNAQLAVMLGATEQQVADALAACESKGIIKGYQAMVDWDQTDRDLVSARIEIKVIPKSTMGFEEIAHKISQFKEVETCYLMSGGYDLALTISGKSFRDVALFVAHQLAPMESVQSTATHFVLRKYKHRGVMMVEDLADEREVSSQ